MTIKNIAELMHDFRVVQYVCLQDCMENVMFVGTLADLEQKYPKALEAEVKEMYTEKYGAFNGVDGLTLVV